MESFNSINQEKQRRVFHIEWYIMHLFDTINGQDEQRRRIKECLRFFYEAGLNKARIDRALSIGRSTTWDYLKKFEESGQSWEEDKTFTETIKA